jgi:hypothetical protein
MTKVRGFILVLTPYTPGAPRSMKMGQPYVQILSLVIFVLRPHARGGHPRSMKIPPRRLSDNSLSLEGDGSGNGASFLIYNT